MTTGDAAKQVGVAPDTIRLWERLGRLPALRTASGVRLFQRTDVDRVVRERLRGRSPR